MGLHVLVAYMKKGLTSEWAGTWVTVTWRQLSGTAACAAHCIWCAEHLVVCGAGTRGIPFDTKDPRKQHYVVGHSGECASKCCAAPWHVDIVTHRQNTMAGQWSRTHRGEHSNVYRYGGPPPNLEENPGVSGLVGWGGVVGWRVACGCGRRR